MLNNPTSVNKHYWTYKQRQTTNIIIVGDFNIPLSLMGHLGKKLTETSKLKKNRDQINITDSYKIFYTAAAQ
jgi:hypothetical protein